jgi:hypothetical protein
MFMKQTNIVVHIRFRNKFSSSCDRHVKHMTTVRNLYILYKFICHKNQMLVFKFNLVLISDRPQEIRIILKVEKHSKRKKKNSTF